MDLNHKIKKLETQLGLNQKLRIVRIMHIITDKNMEERLHSVVILGADSKEHEEELKAKAFADFKESRTKLQPVPPPEISA